MRMRLAQQGAQASRLLKRPGWSGILHSASMVAWRMMLWRLWLCSAMLHKTKRPYDATVMGPGQRLHANLRDLYASNTIPASRTAELFDDAAAAGVLPCRLRRGGFGTKKNTARALRRSLVRQSAGWPPLYEAPIRVFDTKTQATETRPMSFWLPHEMLACLADNAADVGNMYDRGGLDPLSLQHLVKCEGQAGAPLVPLGIWGDAAPCNWDRTESLQVFSLNLPGLTGDNRTLRIPITALSKKSVATDDTYEDILAVVAWSLQWAALGKHPSCRHDDKAWQRADDWRCVAKVAEARIIYLPVWKHLQSRDPGLTN